MPSKTLLIFLGFEALFVGTGALLLVVALVFQPGGAGGSMLGGNDIATSLLLASSPLTGEICQLKLKVLKLTRI